MEQLPIPIQILILLVCLLLGWYAIHKMYYKAYPKKIKVKVR